MLHGETSRRLKSTLFDYEGHIDWELVRGVFKKEGQILTELLDDVAASLEVLQEVKLPKSPNMIDVEISLKPEEPEIEYASAYLYTRKSFLKLLESKKIISDLIFYDGVVEDIYSYKFIAAKFVVVDDLELFKKKAEFVIEKYITDDSKFLPKPHFEEDDFVISDKRLRVGGGFKEMLMLLIKNPRIIHTGSIISPGKETHKLDLMDITKYSEGTFHTQVSKLNDKLEKIQAEIKSTNKNGLFILEINY